MTFRKKPAIVAAVLISVLSAILLFLLTTASSNTALFAHDYPLLMGLNVVLIVALLLAVIIQLARLRREYRQGVFGVRLKSRLLLMLALMAVLPGALVYGVSMQFVMNSIDSWFDVRVDRALEGGLQLARNVLDGQLAELREQTASLALQLADTPEVRPARLERLREQAALQSLTLFGASGRVLAHSAARPDKRPPRSLSTNQLHEARQKGGTALLEDDGEGGGGLVLRVLLPLASPLTQSAEPRILQALRAVPPSIAQSAHSVEAAYRDYQELSLGRLGLNRIYMLSLTLTLLLALFAAIALALLLARRIAAPLLILAEGTQAVAAGDFTPRTALETHDELGVLTQSFNRMTRQLSEAREETERHRHKVEAASAYLESVLANLSSGVMAFDRHFVLRANNRGACAILDDPLNDIDHLPLPDWPAHAELREAILQGFAPAENAHHTAAPREWQQQLEIGSTEAGGMMLTQVLLVRGSTLPEASGGGYVVVFDDITRLIAAQRSLAWGEVARRLAHEIKNPLTPIQLSAERLQHKLADKLDDESRALLQRATQTIVTQVDAMKNMVNEFRDYARMPPAQLQPLDLNNLITDVLELYENARVRVHARLASGLPLVAGDPAQLRQVIHNLLKNAQEASSEALKEAPEKRPEIGITTHREAQAVSFTVSDHGNGFPAQILSHAFEPYVTTKPRGTGLGLAIVKKIIDEHQGEIHIANRSTGGAEVVILLPYA
ncbi:MAG: HAMP domain-containing protein [Sterolibacterium sp.]|jgi:nitrogen fixation/metabolism regulation signal transduction histidine kinase|nr:HAMP domain-containing protein [Sterolibacterium sp.]